MTVLPAALAAATLGWTLGAGAAPRRRLRLQPARAVARWATAAAGGGIASLWWLGGRSPAALVAVAAAAGLLAPLMRVRGRRRQRDAVAADVVALCFGAAAELRAGRSPGEALGAVGAQLGALTEGVRAAARAVRRGAPVDDELCALADRCGSARLRTVAAVWAASADTGAGLADVLERVGGAFAADDEARAELGALAAGPRATALVLCALPVLALGLGAAAGADPAALLLHSPFGWLLTAIAAGLDTGGLLWVRAITIRALA